MQYPIQKSIKQKITAKMMLTSVLALLLASAVYILYDQAQFKEHMVEDMHALAEIISLNSTAALSFDNAREAEEVLSSLWARKHITQAYIFDKQGKVFASYIRAGLKTAPVQSITIPDGDEVVEFQEEYMRVYHHILLRGEIIGQVFLSSDLHQLVDKQKNFAAIAIGILLISSLAAFLIISRVQKSISEPIMALAGTARTVSENKDYSPRAVVKSDDEVGYLTQSFNNMLNQIERQDKALRKTHSQLKRQAKKLKRELQDRQKFERALQLSEQRFRELFDDAPDIFIILDADCRIKDINRRGLQKLDYSRDEMLDRPITDIVSPDDLEKIDRVNKRILYGDVPSNVEVRLLTRDGTLLWVIEEFSVEREQNGSTLSIRVVCRDITDRKKLQEELERAQRLETAGRIAGQIAHDFNNLLGPLAAYPTLMREDLPADHPVVGMANEMEAAANKIAEINQQLLTLARRGHYATTLLDINSVLQRLLGLQQTIARKDIIFETDFETELPQLQGGDAQLTRAFTNLVNNACEAIHGEGTVTIRTQSLDLHAPLLGYQTIKRGDYIRIEITDTGCGIPSDSLQRVFDPFFTTKTMDKLRGSGLGLSVVHGVIKDHNGYITVESQVGQGTTFSIFLPIARQQKSHPTQSPKSPTNITGGTETILIVDDDALQRKVISQLLDRLGYQTEAVTCGEEAIKYVEQSPPDLILLDMVMTGMDGADTYKRILKIRPQQRAIILSGYAISKRVRRALKLGADRFVPKPISFPALAQAVRASLDDEPDESPVSISKSTT